MPKKCGELPVDTIISHLMSQKPDSGGIIRKKLPKKGVFLLLFERGVYSPAALRSSSIALYSSAYKSHTLRS